MANNKSFVIQYLIKARDQYSKAAQKVEKASKKMRKTINKTQRDFKKSNTLIRLSTNKMSASVARDYSNIRISTKVARDSILIDTAIIRSSIERASSRIRNSTKQMSASVIRDYKILRISSGLASQGLLIDSTRISASANIMKIAFRNMSMSVRSSIASMRASFAGFTAVVAKNATKIRNSGLVMSAAVTLPLALLVRSMKNASRDAEETKSKFATVFKDISAESEKNANNLARNFGLTSTKAKKLLGDTGDLLTGFGFTAKEALKMSTTLNKLAVDLASFTNIEGGADRASKALTTSLLGEREAIKSLGIAILEKDVIAKIGQLVAEGNTFKTLRQAKAQATLVLAMEQSKNAIGDFNRTQQELANQERITASRVEDLKESFGDILMPIALQLTQTIRSLAISFTELSPVIKKSILIVAALVAVIGPLLLIIGSIALAIPAIGAAFVAVGITAVPALGVILLMAAKIAAVALLIIAAWRVVSTFFGGFFTGLSDSFGATFGLMIRDLGIVAGQFVSLFGGSSDAFKSMTDFANSGQLIGSIIGGSLDVVMRVLGTIGETIGQIIGLLTTFNFGAFDFGAIADRFTGQAGKDLQAKLKLASDNKIDINTANTVKSEILNNNVTPITTNSRVDVGVQVGLSKGLEQTEEPTVMSENVRRTDVGASAP